MVMLCSADRAHSRFVDRDMVMRFHHGLAVGHPEVCPGSRDEPASRDLVDPGSPMQIDPPSEPSPDLFGDVGRSTDSDEDSIISWADDSEDSEDSGLYDPEPDSEAEPDIYN